MTIVAETPAPQLPLAAAMKEGSKAEHEAAEHSPFMTELFGGRLDRAAYRDYLLRLRLVYRAMEALVREHATDPCVAAVHDSVLERAERIDADLGFWAPEMSVADRDAIESPAARAYAHRLAAAAAEWGGLLMAHHYTRYLGDLSGGQAIGRLIDRTYEVQGQGIAFYDFDIEKVKPYKDGYRNRLNELGLDAGSIARVVDEVKVAFLLNQGLFAELSQDLDRYRTA